MWSLHDANAVFVNKKVKSKDWTSRTLTNPPPHPITSHNISFLLYLPPTLKVDVKCVSPLILGRVYYMSVYMRMWLIWQSFWSYDLTLLYVKKTSFKDFHVVWKIRIFSPKIFMTTCTLVGQDRLKYIVIPRPINLNLRQVS